MKKSDVKDFASTKHKKLPEKKVAKEESNLQERGDFWHPDPEKDRKLGGPGANQRAREDRPGSSKPKSDPKKLRPGESYMQYAKRMRNEETKYDRYDKQDKENKKRDDRMKFGKFYAKAKEAKDRLRPGEVKKWDPEKKRYVSNKVKFLYIEELTVQNYVSISTSTVSKIIKDAVAKIPENEELGEKMVEICLVILAKAVKLTKTDMDDQLLEVVTKAINSREE